jgi:predicted NACHT family NTPase
LQELIPYGGWLLAMALLVWIGAQFFGRFFQELATRFTPQFLRFFGSRVLGTRAIRNYRQALLRNYGKHALGFRKEGTVNVAQVYVPLQYTHEGHRKDINEKLSSSERAVVVGEPGAGKSLLMKYILIAWASAGQRDRQQIPVLVELHRCNANEDSAVSSGQCITSVY